VRICIKLTALAVVAASVARAQVIQYSSEEKFSFRNQDLQVIGKAQGLIFTRIISRQGSEIIAFRSDMKQQWRRWLGFGHTDESLESIFSLDSGFVAFYSWREKNVQTVGARRLFLNLSSDSAGITLDTFHRTVADGFPDYYFSVSDDGSKYLCYFVTPRAGQGDLLTYTVLDDSLGVITRSQLSLPTEPRKAAFETAMVANDGEVFVVINEYADPGVPVSRRFWLLRSKEKMVANDLFSVSGEQRWMNNLAFKVDNENSHVVAAGFYSLDPKRITTAEGVFFVSFDLNGRRKQVETFVAFAPEFIAKIKGARQPSRHTERLYTFVVDNIILRKDGGAIIVAESYQKTMRPRNTAVVADPYGPYSYGEASITYYFEELLVISLLPSGDVHWKNVLIKSQVSSGDNGRFSSYITMNTGARVNFIFNDEVRYRTNVVQYSVDPTGEVQREIIFNARKYDLYLMPQLGKQVSSREMVIPSYKKGRLRFVKLNYSP
jgi:hypothetical protein